MNMIEFRKDLMHIMPGYKWTVHRSCNTAKYLEATGIQSSGFNRLSTLSVVRRKSECNTDVYEVKSSGFGVNAPWVHVVRDSTLARALRALQNYYERQAQQFSGLASNMEHGRKPKQGLQARAE